MKRCPQCGRQYDLTMSFCLDDGAELLYDPASMDEPATAILPTTDAVGDAPTRAQLQRRTSPLKLGEFTAGRIQTPAYNRKLYFRVVTLTGSLRMNLPE